MEVLGTKQIAKGAAGGRTFLSLHERTVRTDSGSEFGYFFVARGEDVPSPEDKKPEAVIVVAVVDTPGEERRLVLTSEFRVPINCREVGFPAGLIDPEDYAGGASVCTAARIAAIREMKEETGLDFIPTEISPENLYSSAGMTNESVIIVFGVAQGTPSVEGNEECEDIDTTLFTFAEMVEMMDKRNVVYSKTAWPFLWAFKLSGGFTQFPVVNQRTEEALYWKEQQHLMGNEVDDQ